MSRVYLFSRRAVFLLLAFHLFFPSVCGAAKPVDPFVAVFVDDRTESRLGTFPYERIEYARVVAQLRKAGAKAVIIKFFLDKPKTQGGDEALASEIARGPVYLQARLDSDEQNPNPFPQQWDRRRSVQGDFLGLTWGNSGWIPLPIFAEDCQGIGFVDSFSDNALDIPMLEKYQNFIAPSLELEALEAAFGEKAHISMKDGIRLGGHRLPLDKRGGVEVLISNSAPFHPLSFLDVRQGQFDPNLVRGKVVILGFDAKETPVIQTPQGPVRIHRFFYGVVESLWAQFQSH